jgi:leader peptidase (prepilin peptidase) / N-methyltransferase
MFDSRTWAAVPFHFWSVVSFVLGCIVGSFLNVCIHRMPRDESIVSPPSHCPHCNYSIPWYLNVPLVTWLWLRGRCRNCGAPISIRYFLVELLAGLTFLGCWLAFGGQSAWLALINAAFLAGLIVATFIDFEHLFIPDEITIGGIFAGLLCSVLLPRLHGQVSPAGGLWQSVLGIGVGGGLIYCIVRLGKLFLGRHKLAFPADSKIIFTDTTLQLPDEEYDYGELFYRKSDAITLHARTVELVDRCYRDVPVRLTQTTLQIGDDKMDPEEIPHLEAVSGGIVLPREAMGLGDVKFMAAIGAFLGWQAVLFALTAGAWIGTAYAMGMIALKKKEWSGRLYFGPFLAMGAAIWIFAGQRLLELAMELVMPK